MIVVGNKRVQGAARVLGSIAGDVAKRAPCNVLHRSHHRYSLGLSLRSSLSVTPRVVVG